MHLHSPAATAQRIPGNSLVLVGSEGVPVSAPPADPYGQDALCSIVTPKLGAALAPLTLRDVYCELDGVHP